MKIALAEGRFALVDDEDWHRVCNYKWHFGPSHPYVVTFNRPFVGDILPLHRVVLGLAHGDRRKVVHRTGDWLDCRKENLVVTGWGPPQYGQKLSRRNSTGYKGVSRKKGRNLYVARIRCEGRVHHLGYYRSPEDAADAYDEAAVRLFGELALTNAMMRAAKGDVD